MKQKILIIIVAICCVALASCNAKTQQSTQEELSQNNSPSMSETDNAIQNTALETESLSKTTAEDNNFIDLTNLSSIVVYSEVYNMMVTPENYIGKTIKTNGTFWMYPNEEKNTNYYSCIISDAMACCQQGIGFVLADDKNITSYPANGTDITITGTFVRYQKDGKNYCRLENATMETK